MAEAGGPFGANTRAQDGCTPLICAAENGHADCVRLLLDAGADKEAKMTGVRLFVRRVCGWDQNYGVVASDLSAITLMYMQCESNPRNAERPLTMRGQALVRGLVSI